MVDTKIASGAPQPQSQAACDAAPQNDEETEELEGDEGEVDEEEGSEGSEEAAVVAGAKAKRAGGRFEAIGGEENDGDDSDS